MCTVFMKDCWKQQHAHSWYLNWISPFKTITRKWHTICKCPKSHAVFKPRTEWMLCWEGTQQNLSPGILHISQHSTIMSVKHHMLWSEEAYNSCLHTLKHTCICNFNGHKLCHAEKTHWKKSTWCQPYFLTCLPVNDSD